MIPREGVESATAAYTQRHTYYVIPVIPREGVESELLNHLNAVVAEKTVIPREGVESLTPRATCSFHGLTK